MRRHRLMVAGLLAGSMTLAACGLVGGGGGGAVQTLAKAEGWRDGLADDAFGVAEVAFDRESAERAWADNVPDGLPEGSGDAEAPGIYGDLDDVDFDTQVVVVWSSGQSGSCAEWIDDIDTTDDGVVTIERGVDVGPTEGCTDDYNPYRTVLAVDRDRLPDEGELPTNVVEGVPNSSVVVYPS